LLALSQFYLSLRKWLKPFFRVTRLDKISSVGRVLSLCNFFIEERAQNFGVLFPLQYKVTYVLILAKHGFGYILGDFFSQTHLVTLPFLHSGCKGLRIVWEGSLALILSLSAFLP
jgi:hypothetical protein